MRSKYSNAYKALILEHKIDKEVRDIKKSFYNQDKTIIIDKNTGQIDQEFSIGWESWKKENSKLPKYDCALRLNISKKNKAKKVRQKIEKLVLTGQSKFITLTFTDEVLAKTSPLTRRRYVARYLKEHSPFYVANVDYSPNKHREHYHAIVVERCDLTKWIYGFAFIEQVRNQDKDIRRTAYYVAKLTSHALKVNGNVPRLIYSRETL